MGVSTGDGGGFYRGPTTIEVPKPFEPQSKDIFKLLMYLAEIFIFDIGLTVSLHGSGMLLAAKMDSPHRGWQTNIDVDGDWFDVQTGGHQHNYDMYAPGSIARMVNDLAGQVDLHVEWNEAEDEIVRVLPIIQPEGRRVSFL
jgi:hypothetical protein